MVNASVIFHFQLALYSVIYASLRLCSYGSQVSKFEAIILTQSYCSLDAELVLLKYVSLTEFVSEL